MVSVRKLSGLRNLAEVQTQYSVSFDSKKANSELLLKDYVCA